MRNKEIITKDDEEQIRELMSLLQDLSFYTKCEDLQFRIHQGTILYINISITNFLLKKLKNFFFV